MTLFTKLPGTGVNSEEGICALPPHCGKSRKKTMTIRTILLCWLCNRATDLTVDLYSGATLGAPRYWCRDCLRPRNFSKRLRSRIAQEEARDALDVTVWNALQKLLAIEEAFEDRAESLAA